MWSNGSAFGGRNLPGKIKLTRTEGKSSPVAKNQQKSSFSSDSPDFEEWTEEEPQEESEVVEDVAQEESQSSSSTSLAISSLASIFEKKLEINATDSTKTIRIKKELNASSVDLDALRELSWTGVPSELRPVVWRLLLGISPPSSDRRESVLSRKRQEYSEWIPQYYDIPNNERSDDEIHTIRQIAVDAPRTVPEVPFFQHPQIQTSLQRILYIWAIRHPASGYVQGINDLVTPFLTVFLAEHFEVEMEDWDLNSLSEEAILQVEADCFWCLSKLLDGIQDHYTFAQPGIQRMVFKLKELIRRIDGQVSKQMEDQGLEFLQFAFRWFNCLLIREIPFSLVTRLWDTYLAEGDGFADFLVYVCASFLLTWCDQLRNLDFQELVLFLQHVPTRQWTVKELETTLSKAFMWQSRFARSPNHFVSK